MRKSILVLLMTLGVVATMSTNVAAQQHSYYSSYATHPYNSGYGNGYYRTSSIAEALVHLVIGTARIGVQILRDNYYISQQRKYQVLYREMAQNQYEYYYVGDDGNPYQLQIRNNQYCPIDEQVSYQQPQVEGSPSPLYDADGKRNYNHPLVRDVTPDQSMQRTLNTVGYGLNAVPQPSIRRVRVVNIY
jgi:hypothetical protein